MPNLLKSLPKEILEKEDSKFIYNVLNPLLLDKVKETGSDTTVVHKVSSLLNKDINLKGTFLPEFSLPYNINSREFNVYMTNGQETKKIEFFGKTELIKELDELKDYIFFYFSVPGYGFIYDLVKKYYYIQNEYETNKQLYEINFEKYNETKDIKTKKVYKSTYEHFKSLYVEHKDLLDEFNILLDECSRYNDCSINQMVDNFAREIGYHLNIKTFDNEIIFKESKLFKYLDTEKYGSTVDKHIFSGKNILSTNTFPFDNMFELIAIFAMEIFVIKSKYDNYLKLIIENGDGYALDRSEHKKLKNTIQKNVTINLNSDNLTYFLNEEKNELEIYTYFIKDFRIDESTFKLYINGVEIPPSINSLTGKFNYGYTIFEYFDSDTKYYKLTVHEFLVYSLEDRYVNYDITDIEVKFDALQTSFKQVEAPPSLYMETNKFLDNFVIYSKNETTGFFEKLNVAFKVKISIAEKDDIYLRVYELSGINVSSQKVLNNQTEMIIGCYEYDYVYEPKIYVDFFKYERNDVYFRYNTIAPYVLIDDVIDNELELVYYAEIFDNSYSDNIYKNIRMVDGGIYKKLYDEIDHMILLNPYNESNYKYVSKINFSQYNILPHTSQINIYDKIEKIPFRENLKYLDKVDVDLERNMIIFMYRGVQRVIPIHEGLVRGFNYESIHIATNGMLNFHGIEILDNEQFIYTQNGIFLKNPVSNVYELIEAAATQKINLTTQDREIFFDIFEMAHCVILNDKKYKVDGLYIDTYKNALNVSRPVMFVESKYGIPRFKTPDNNILDVDFSKKISLELTDEIGSICFDFENKTLIYRYSMDGYYEMPVIELVVKKPYHRQLGMNAFSIFYAGNVLPENSNKTFSGRENIYNSMFMLDDIYRIGRSGDIISDTQQQKLLSEQMDHDIDDAVKYNMERDPFLLFKTSTASFKGLESYLKSNLKSISQDIGISPVYLVQRNRFISEWSRVSSVLPRNDFAASSLKDLVADLMETKLLNNGYDDLIDIFKNNEFEKFSLDTNNIHSVLIQYVLRYLEEDRLLENFSYYLIHEVWMLNNRKKIIDFIKLYGDDKTIYDVSNLKFIIEEDKLKLFYMFVHELSKKNKQIIESYIPITNYSDWELYKENNHVKFEKPFKYEVIDISDFITMPIDWLQPLYMIRPLNDDGYFVRRDFRFLDLSMVTNSQITYDDAYNEYVEDIKNKMNKPVDYLFETLRMLNSLSIEGGFDFLGVNLVIVKWIVDRFLPTYTTTNIVDTVEKLLFGIKQELTSAEHPNMIVSFNKIKESTILGDLGSNIQTIYDSIIQGGMVNNTIVRMDISSKVELEYLDKIKKPLEHYFDYLFYEKRHDIITKILALFTEDVIATSLVDLSFAINIKNSKGDSTFDIYEKMIHSIFDEFLPFHTVLDKIIFTIKVMETSSSEAVSKQVDAALSDNALISIMLDFTEKIRIHTFDALMTVISNMSIYSEGLKLCGGHDEIPYDYDRKVRVAGHDIPSHMDELEYFGMDDDWYIVNRDNWRHRPNDIYTPPEFADFNWNCGAPVGEFEQVTDAYINDYYHIKLDIFNKDERIESYFVDSLPIIDITQGVSDIPEIDVTEDYLIAIDSTYKIKFYDMELIGHDDFGLDEAWGPEDQTTLIGMREEIRQLVMHDFYEKIYVSTLDSIWSDIVVVFDLYNVPGHDEFGIDENYHQSSPERLNQEISVMIYDELLTTGFNITHTEMSDVSLIDKVVATKVALEYDELILNTLVEDSFMVTVNIFEHRYFDSDGHFLRPGHSEFVYDEYYHNSGESNRLDNTIDMILTDYMGDIRIDFGFMRMLPFDPYADMMDKKFYRGNQPGSDLQVSRVRDKFYTTIHTSSKDVIRVGIMDFYFIGLISDDVRRGIYYDVERDNIGGDLLDSYISEYGFSYNVRFDFRENIIAIDKFATILDDVNILDIHGVDSAGKTEKDELFKLELGDKIYNNIKIKHPVERARTKFDRDYLKSIKVEEENFVEFKYMDSNIKVRFEDIMRSYYKLNEKSLILIDESTIFALAQFNQETSKITVLDKVHYGHHYGFEIDGMIVSMDDSLLEVWSNKIHHDSMVISITDEYDLKTYVDSSYDFQLRPLQPHDEYGHMGYTDESMERSLDSRLSDSLIQTSHEELFESFSVSIYDGLMHDVHHFFGDYIDVVISDSLKTYIEIIKRPWIMPAYDDFGHNEYPHMYHGESEEFDVSTKLSDAMKLDSYTHLFDHGVLADINDRIFSDYNTNVGSSTVSASMCDDLKIISIGFKDIIGISTSDTIETNRDTDKTDVAVGVSDTVWFGLKLRDEELRTVIRDSVYYEVTDEDVIYKDYGRATLRDWILFSYVFVDDKPQIRITDKVKYYGFANPKDTTVVSMRESIVVKDWLTTYMPTDTGKIYISDKLFTDSNGSEFTEIVDADITLKDVAKTTYKEKLGYGRGRKFTEPLMIYADNRLYSTNESMDSVPLVNTTIYDSFYSGVVIAPFRDRMEISTYERMKFGPVFRDRTHVSFNENFDIRLQWMDDRFSVDEFLHNETTMEYYNDSASRQMSAIVKDDIKILEARYVFSDSLNILSSDQINTNNKPQEKIDFRLVFKDKTQVLMLDHLTTGYSWLIDRYGVDMMPHDNVSLEYYNDSIDRQLSTYSKDDIKVVDIHRTFGDSLIILSSDQIEMIYNSTDLSENSMVVDGLVVMSNDALMYGDGKYDYIWDAKEWDGFGYTLPYESWVGHVPHDDFPYDSMEHSDQGDDLSQVNTGVYDKVDYNFSLYFRESIGVAFSDLLKSEIEDNTILMPLITNSADIMIGERSLSIINNMFGDIISLTVSDRLTIEDKLQDDIIKKDIGIVVMSNDTLMYGIGNYDYVWDSKEWSKYGYSVPYENWSGAIPHDDFPYDIMGHAEQGDDLSQITTGVKETVIYELSLRFKESFGVRISDYLVTPNILVKTNNDGVIVQTIDDRLTGEFNFEFYNGLIINAYDGVVTNLETSGKDVGMNITFDDSLLYGEHINNMVWSYRDWSDYGDTLPYAKWFGQIPHDDFPYDNMTHDTQGDDISQISTGVTENLFYGFDFIFKDTLIVSASDANGFSSWGYQSIFKENSKIFVASRLTTDRHISSQPTVNAELKKESLSVSYVFDDKIKKHNITPFDDNKSIEEINIYDAELHQLIESIIKYRFYETLDIQINSDILSSVLFKFDESMGMVLNNKTKIDLYRTEDDGSITKSMTVIQDKSSARIEMLFGDSISSQMTDNLVYFSDEI